MALEVTVLEHLILPFQAIVCIHTNNKAIAAEGPNPFLQGKTLLALL